MEGLFICLVSLSHTLIISLTFFFYFKCHMNFVTTSVLFFFPLLPDDCFFLLSCVSLGISITLWQIRRVYFPNLHYFLLSPCISIVRYFFTLTYFCLFEIFSFRFCFSFRLPLPLRLAGLIHFSPLPPLYPLCQALPHSLHCLSVFPSSCFRLYYFLKDALSRPALASSSHPSRDFFARS